MLKTALSALAKNVTPPDDFGRIDSLLTFLELFRNSTKFLSEFAKFTVKPYTLRFDETERGKTVYVALCWQNQRGQLGPWTGMQSTIVP
jgi:hypothetical protein